MTNVAIFCLIFGVIAVFLYIIILYFIMKVQEKIKIVIHNEERMKDFRRMCGPDKDDKQEK